MNQFITYQFVTESVKDMHTGYWLLDTLIKSSIPIYLIISSDMRYMNIFKEKLYNLSDMTKGILCKKTDIEFKLCSQQQSNFEGGYSSCSEVMKAIIYDINNSIYIESEKIKKCSIKKYEEIPINDGDGYGEDINLVVPLGFIIIDDITIKINIASETLEGKKGNRQEFRKVVIYLYSSSKANTVNYIEQSTERYIKNLNKASNKCMKWFRLRPSQSNRDETVSRRNLVFFSKNIENQSSFDNMFFKGKKELIQKLDDFFFGRISKMCLILHGNPGGGKDSLIIAITRYLSQLSKENPINKHYDLFHIISASIDLLNSDDAFLRFMFGNDKIDNTTIEHNRQIKVIPEVEKYVPQIICKDEIIEKYKTAQTSNDKKAEKQEGVKTGLMEIIGNSTLSCSDDFKNIDMKSLMTAAAENKQQLKKATIIEALDSYMNQNGTFCIFTTNLPLDAIDPILIRAGRLEPFEMGYSSLEVTTDLLASRYSYQEVNKHLGPNGDLGISHDKIMPSTIVKYLNDCYTLEETIEKLQNL